MGHVVGTRTTTTLIALHKHARAIPRAAPKMVKIIRLVVSLRKASRMMCFRRTPLRRNLFPWLSPVGYGVDLKRYAHYSECETRRVSTCVFCLRELHGFYGFWS